VAGPVDGGADKTIIAYTEGSTLTVVDSGGTHQVDAGTISELAITPSAGTPSLRFQLYWTNAGAPKTHSLN
jgi:hypothetical protein